MGDVDHVKMNDTCVLTPFNRVSDEQFVSYHDLFVGTHRDMLGNLWNRNIKGIVLVGIRNHLVQLHASTMRMVGLDGKGPMWV